jgi:hypothetical protein
MLRSIATIENTSTKRSAKVQTMEFVESWAVKIATVIAPNEVDLAPEMTAAYLAGGEAREQLYMKSQGGGLGGFGSGEVQAVFPVLLNSITAAGSAIMSMLCTPEVGIILAVVKSSLEIKTLADRQKKVSEVLPEQTYRSLKVTLDVFTAGLKSSGYSQDECDRKSYQLMMTLLENPDSAQQFVKLLTAPTALPKQTNQRKNKRK